MPQARDIALEQLTAAGDPLVGVTETRVDPAHSIGDALVRPPALAEMPVAEAITDLVRVEGAVQLQSQADQLAAHLRQRRQELDRRESQLNSRLADFEKEVREARLWLSERNDELNEREARVQGSGTQWVPGVQGSGTQRVPGVQGSGVRGSGTDADRTFSEGYALCGSLPAQGSGDSVTHGARLRGSQSGNGEHDSHEMGSKENALDGVPRPDEAVSQLVLLRRSEELDRRWAALEIFQEKVSQMHSEALELRLAAEEAQAELRASLGAEVADDAVALARQRLARYSHDEQAESTRKREELVRLKLDLAAEHDRLERRYQQLKEFISPNGVDSTSPDPLLTRQLATDHSPLTTRH